MLSLRLNATPTASLGLALAYLGDVMSGTRGIRQNALLTLTLHYPRRGGHPRSAGHQTAMGGQPSLRPNLEVPAPVGFAQA